MTTLGKYEIHEVIGKGGFATVYRATHRSLGNEAAVKVLDTTHIEGTARQRFVREAQVAAGLDHPNIVRVLALGEEDSQVFIAMEYFPEGDLTCWIKNHGPLTRSGMLAVLGDVAAALDYAHARQAWHRDVKPGNILMDAAGRAHLGDFGLVAMPESPHLTQIGGVVGSPAYMSPEQAEGRALDGRADQYSLAVIAYELITGKAPFTAESSTTVALMHLTQPPPVPSQVNPDVPVEVDAVLLRGLAKKAEERYSTCGDLVRALESAFMESNARRFRQLLAEALETVQAGQPEKANALLMDLARLAPSTPQGAAALQSLEAELGYARQYAALAQNWDAARKQAARALERSPNLSDPEGIFPLLGLRAAPRPPILQTLKAAGLGLLIAALPALLILVLFWLWIDHA